MLLKFLNYLLDKGDTSDRPASPVAIEAPVSRRLIDDDSEDQGPRFRGSAKHRSRGGGDDGVRQRLREAFVPSQPVLSRRLFAGRSTLLRELIQAVEDQRLHLVIFGQRGIGKTSLLRIFTESAREADYLVLHENCGSGSDFDEFFRAICGQIPLIYFGALPPSETQIREGASLADVLPSGNLGAHHVGRVLSQVAGTRIIVILDEFDRVESSQYKKKVAELIKNLSDLSASVQLVIAGVAENLQDLLEHSPSIRRNVIGISVERMSNDEIQKIIVGGERHASIEFKPDARSAVIECAQGSPYVARLLCHHSSLSAVTDQRRTVEISDVGYAVNQSLQEMEARLGEMSRSRANHWLSKEPAIMLEIARAGLSGTGSFRIQDLYASGRLARDDVPAVIDRLVAGGGILQQSPGSRDKYRLEEEGLTTYLLLATSRLARTT